MTGLMREGDRSHQVADVQARLRGLGFSIDDAAGLYGSTTRQAVRAFQQGRNILADGIVGPHTWAELVESSWRLGDRPLYVKQPLMRGDDVLTLQTQLNALGFDAGRADGIFGPTTDAGVRAFQKEYGVLEDGIFGARSRLALQGLRVDRPGMAAVLREELHSSSRTGIAGTKVMVDPGHGAADPGEQGLGGSIEEQLCWDIADQLAAGLRRSGAIARLTRSGLDTPDLQERARRANRAGADLFLSVHLNSHSETAAQGASTYYFGGSRAGETLAELILAELVSLGLADCRSHARSYTVLRETRMPAVLVEPGFISNPLDEKRLDDPGFRRAVAAAILRGVQRHFGNLPA